VHTHTYTHISDMQAKNMSGQCKAAVRNSGGVSHERRMIGSSDKIMHAQVPTAKVSNILLSVYLHLFCFVEVKKKEM